MKSIFKYNIFMVFFILLAFCGFHSAPSLAAENSGAHQHTPRPQSTRIVPDPKSGAILFYVKGELAAVLKSDGLHVRNGISYGGEMTDYGRAGFEHAVKQTGLNAGNEE